MQSALLTAPEIVRLLHRTGTGHEMCFCLEKRSSELQGAKRYLPLCWGFDHLQTFDQQKPIKLAH